MTIETTEARDDTNAAEDRSSYEESKDLGAVLSYQVKDNEEGTTGTKGESPGKSEEEPESEEEEEEEGEIEITTRRLTKTKGRKSRKEVWEQATYKDKLQGSQLTLDKLLKNPRNTRQHGHAPKGMPSTSKSK